MSDTKYTPEPWQNFEATIGVAIQVGENEWEPMQIGSFARIEDAERSKLCVNYCAGVETEILEELRAPNLRELMAAYPDPEEVPMLESRVNALQDSLDHMTERAHNAEAHIAELEAEIDLANQQYANAYKHGAKAEAQRDALLGSSKRAVGLISCIQVVSGKTWHRDAASGILCEAIAKAEGE